MRDKLVIGYFGYLSNKLDGQTVKTRSFYELLEEVDERSTFFDTESFKASKLSLLRLLWLIIFSKTIYYFPAHNSLKFFFPILYWMCKIFKKKLYYFMIGGWLTNFLRENKHIERKLGKIDRIFCETYTIRQELFEEFKFSNLDYFPNFRDGDFKPHFNQVDSKNVKMVYMGRLNAEKGIIDIFELEKYLSSAGITNYSIDLYGQVKKEFELDFSKALSDSERVKYRRVLQPSEIQSVLTDYDLMLFPTHFYTEGFPGTILDAYLSGIPVVACDWKHASEYVDHNITGLIYKFMNIEDFFYKVKSLLKEPSVISMMQQNAYHKSMNYTKKFALNLIKQYIV